MTKQRIYNLDFLRGVVIFMAVFQHYTGYFNYWYIDFFIKEHEFWESTYSSHMSMVDKLLPMDGITSLLSMYLVPWVSQIYLALACFNLAAKDKETVRGTLRQKLILYISVLVVLYIEGLIIGPNFGEAISFYPVMLWMIILAILSIIYSFLGLVGIIILTILSLFQDVLGISNLLFSIEAFVKSSVHPAFELDANIDLFITSGCIGFIYGWVWHHKPLLRERNNYISLFISSLFFTLFLVFGDGFNINIDDIYASEHTMALSTIGRVGIWGIEFMVIGIFLLLHIKGINVNVKPINWIGMFSLTVFILHKSIFIYLWGPLLTLISSKINTVLEVNFFITLIICSLSILIIYLFKISKIWYFVLGLQQDEVWRNVYSKRKK